MESGSEARGGLLSCPGASGSEAQPLASSASLSLRFTRGPSQAQTHFCLRLASPLTANMQTLPMRSSSNSQKEESDPKRILPFLGATGTMLTSL